MQSKEQLEKRRESLKKELDALVSTAKDNIAKAESDLQNRQENLRAYTKQTQTRIDRFEGAIAMINETLAGPEAKESQDKPPSGGDITPGPDLKVAEKPKRQKAPKSAQPWQPGQ